MGGKGKDAPNRLIIVSLNIIIDEAVKICYNIIVEAAAFGADKMTGYYYGGFNNEERKRRNNGNAE